VLEFYTLTTNGSVLDNICMNCLAYYIIKSL